MTGKGPQGRAGPAMTNQMSEHRVPQRQHRLTLCRHFCRVEVGRLFVQARPVLDVTQFAVGTGGGVTDTVREKTEQLGSLQ